VISGIDSAAENLYLPSGTDCPSAIAFADGAHKTPVRSTPAALTSATAALDTRLLGFITSLPTCW
jgi:hypothetical protein